MKLVEFQSNIYPYYENADVFALTSAWEEFGNVLLVPARLYSSGTLLA